MIINPLQLGLFADIETATEQDAAYRGDWVTPWPEFRLINAALGHAFYLDVAASSKNAKCLAYITAEQDALQQSWDVPEGALWWCNPDFRLSLDFILKAYEEMGRGNHGIMLLPANTDRPLFGLIEELGLRVLFWGTNTPGINGRINFIDPTSQKRAANAKGSILVAFTDRPLPGIAGRKWWGVQHGIY